MSPEEIQNQDQVLLREEERVGESFALDPGWDRTIYQDMLVCPLCDQYGDECVC